MSYAVVKIVSPPSLATTAALYGSSIWHSIYAFPPTSQAYWDAGFDDFAKRWGPILEAFDDVDVNFGLEVHPTEIAFDIASAERAVTAVKGHRRFGFNYDPSHLGYQGVDYVTTPGAPLVTRATFVVESGRPGAKAE